MLQYITVMLHDKMRLNKVAFCILNVKQEKIARDHSQQVMTSGNGGDACRIEGRRRDSQHVMTSVESRDGGGTPVQYLNLEASSF